MGERAADIARADQRDLAACHGRSLGLSGAAIAVVSQRRATIIFLISAIALAGFRCLGQVRVQFMMVWQR